MTDNAPMRLDDIRERLLPLAGSAPPRLRALAAWLIDRPEELAFNSVRSLADLAGTNPNTVVRLAQALGFSGFEQARGAMQQVLRGGASGYAARAAALSHRPPERLMAELRAAAEENIADVFAPRSLAALAEIVPHLLAARQVHCIGVRTAYALAHYFTYRGGMAHPNIVPAPSQPGLILDALTEAGPEDVVIAISFAHYSSEVLRAADAARSRGARLLAVTDGYASPLARGAWRVLRPPMRGPNLMFPLAGAFLLIEALLEAMAAQDSRAEARIERFETRLLEVGAYRKG